MPSPGIVLLAEEQDLLDLVERCVPEDLTVVVSTCYPRRLPVYEPLPVILLATERVDSAWCVAALGHLRRMRSGGDLVIVTRFNEHNAADLALCRPTAVSWFHEMEHTLADVLRVAMHSTSQDRMLRRLKGLIRVDDSLLERAIEVVLTRRPHVSTVEELARALHCSSNTLRYRWRTRGMPGTPQELVQLGMLLRLAHFLERGVPLNNALRALATPHSTAFRRARRWLSVSPSRVTLPSLWEALERWACAAG